MSPMGVTVIFTAERKAKEMKYCPKALHCLTHTNKTLLLLIIIIITIPPPPNILLILRERVKEREKEKH